MSKGSSEKNVNIIWEEQIDQETSKIIYVGITEGEEASFLVEEAESDDSPEGKYRWLLSFTPELFFGTKSTDIYSYGCAETVGEAMQSARKTYEKVIAENPIKKYRYFRKKK